MGVLDKIFKKGVDETIGAVGEVLDNVITTQNERDTAKKELAEVLNSKLIEMASLQRDLILSETSGNKLQRNWRPILALTFGFIVVSTYFIFPTINLWVKSADLQVLIQDLKNNNGFWFLMELMIGGYVASRGLEKITDTFSKNVDLSSLRKKDRKAAMK